MKKVVRINESKLISLLKTIINESLSNPQNFDDDKWLTSDDIEDNPPYDLDKLANEVEKSIKINNGDNVDITFVGDQNYEKIKHGTDKKVSRKIQIVDVNVILDDDRHINIKYNFAFYKDSLNNVKQYIEPETITYIVDDKKIELKHPTKKIYTGNKKYVDQKTSNPIIDVLEDLLNIRKKILQSVLGTKS